jgi:hypothetical protein
LAQAALVLVVVVRRDQTVLILYLVQLHQLVAVEAQGMLPLELAVRVVLAVAVLKQAVLAVRVIHHLHHQAKAIMAVML